MWCCFMSCAEARQFDLARFADLLLSLMGYADYTYVIVYPRSFKAPMLRSVTVFCPVRIEIALA